jgi:hypothetical protein
MSRQNQAFLTGGKVNGYQGDLGYNLPVLEIRHTQAIFSTAEGKYWLYILVNSKYSSI